MYKCPTCGSMINSEADIKRPIDFELLSQAAKRLTPRNWIVLKRMYCDEEHVSNIAKDLHILQASVIDIENEALEKMVYIFRKLNRPARKQEIKEAIAQFKNEIKTNQIVHKVVRIEDVL